MTFGCKVLGDSSSCLLLLAALARSSWISHLVSCSPLALALISRLVSTVRLLQNMNIKKGGNYVPVGHLARPGGSFSSFQVNQSLRKPPLSTYMHTRAHTHTHTHTPTQVLGQVGVQSTGSPKTLPSAASTSSLLRWLLFIHFWCVWWSLFLQMNFFFIQKNTFWNRQQQDNI